MSVIEECFKRKPKDVLAKIEVKIEEQRSIKEEASEIIDILIDEKRKLDIEYFCGRRIIVENEQVMGYGMHYELAVVFPSLRMEARVYPNAHDNGKTFIAVVGEWGVNSEYPKWYYEKCPCSQKDIKTFEEAKVIALERLKGLIDDVL